MTAKVLFLDGIRGHRDEPTPAAPVYVSEPLPILPDGSFGELCAICDAFGRVCCKSHREFVPSTSLRHASDYPESATRTRWQGDGEGR